MKRRQLAQILLALLVLANTPLPSNALQQRSVDATKEVSKGHPHFLPGEQKLDSASGPAAGGRSVDGSHLAGLHSRNGASWQYKDGRTDGHDKNNINKNKQNVDVVRKERKDERALETLAPADTDAGHAGHGRDELAVRAPSPAVARSAVAGGSSGGLSSSLRARSLQDWVVEDIILMATVDGTLYARDRKTGAHRWSLQAERPMVETTYYSKNRTSGSRSSDARATMDRIYWIVEPTQDGSLYLFTPGSSLGMQKLDLTVKSLVEDHSPYYSDDPPVVYTGEKRSHLYTVDIGTGNMLKSFSPSGGLMTENVCRPAGSLDTTESQECGAMGTLTIGRTEYIVAIQNSATSEPICTIRYFEWGPNNRDKDLFNQYTSSKDGSHVYSLHDGKILAVDSVSDLNKLLDLSKQAMYTQKFQYPVVRVFDVARYIHASSLDTPLIILPQPDVPAQFSHDSLLEGINKRVFVNCTEEGNWYALSENSFPLVTRGAIPAQCSQQGWLSSLPPRELLKDWQVEEALVGTHDLSDGQERPPVGVPLIDGPKEPPQTIEPPEDIHSEESAKALAKRSSTDPVRLFVALVVIALTVAGFRIRNTAKNLENPFSAEKATAAMGEFGTANLLPDAIARDDSTGVNATTNILTTSTEIREADVAQINTETTPSIETAEAAVEVQVVVEGEKEEKKGEKKVVSKDIDEPIIEKIEEEVEPAKGTNLVVEAPVTQETKPALEENEAVALEKVEEISASDAVKPIEEMAEPETPKPKTKKAHRGKRGGKREAEKRRARASNDSNKEQVDVADSLALGADQAREQVVVVKPDGVNHTTSSGNNSDTSPGIRGLVIRTDRVLGNGSGGTFVFEGEFEGRHVAVKRMLPQFFELASQEVALLEQNDDHPNVIRYFCRREDEHFLYIALELCQASLWDLFRDGRGEGLSDLKYAPLIQEINREPVKVLTQLAEGVKHLHNFRIVHRDIKPQNMLIAYAKKNSVNSFPRFVISDFGLCKTLPDGGSTLIGATITAGTAGWKAPELISQPRDVTSNGSSTGTRDEAMAAAMGVKRAVDIFSLGCVFFYVLTGGLHPFDDEEGWMAIRERNIKANRCNLAAIEMHGQDTVDLIKWMLSPNPEDRPTATEVLAHPFFWTPRDRLEFLSLASDRFDMEPRDGTSHALTELETHAGEIIGLPPKPPPPVPISTGPLWSKIHTKNASRDIISPPPLPVAAPLEPNFLNVLDKKFTDTLGKQRKYNGAKLVDLLRALRNKHHHWDDMPDDVKQRVGEVPEGYLQYWEKRFPMLVVGVWRAVRRLGMGEERRFWRWYGEKCG